MTLTPERTAPPVPSLVDLGDLQGDVLRAYGNAFVRTTYLVLHLPGSVPAARAWLSGLLDLVTTAAPWPPGTKPRHTLNVALTATGLRALGLGEAALGSFSAEFRQGMAARARVLGDTGPSAPDTWLPGLGTGAGHALLTVNAQSADDLEAALAGLPLGAAEVLLRHDAELLPDAREHFGFADGFAQPAVEGFDDARAPGGGVPLGGGAWRPLAVGEFVLGYPDEETRLDRRRRLPRAPVAPLGRNGTYLVWRLLHQDVAGWRRALREDAAHLPGGEQLLAAKAVGRWPDGAPLTTHPDGPPEGYDARAPEANDFRYADDDGSRCPLGAHVRRSNPRDALGFDGALSFRHRIIRRGMPYGPPLPEGVLEDDGVERGLVFACFQASIGRQFEGVQVQWLGAGNVFGLGHDRDPLLGGGLVVQGDPPYVVPQREPFVRTRGGEYLFQPGTTALCALADGTAG